MPKELTASDGSVQRTKEALLADLKRVVDDADALVKEMSDATAEEFSSTRSRFEAKLDEARSRIDDARILVTRKVCGAADATSAYLHENPGTVIGVATTVGLITAFLMMRRSSR